MKLEKWKYLKITVVGVPSRVGLFTFDEATEIKRLSKLTPNTIEECVLFDSITKEGFERWDNRNK